MTRLPDKRVAILGVGAEILYRRGYNATGVKDIVAAAGIPKGSFYNYFESKQAFAIEALDAIASEQHRQLEAALRNPAKPPLERIRGFFEDFVAGQEARGEFTGGCPVGNLAQEMADHSPAIARRVEHWFRRLEGLLATCLREASERGDLPRDRDPEALAAFVFNAWEGALLRMKAAKGVDPLRNFLDHLDLCLAA